MVRLDLTLPTLAENLALDEALLMEAETGGPDVLRFWSWPRLAVVIGAGGKVADEVHVQRCAAAGIPVMRRSSGGGTVLLGPGCLLYSMILTIDSHPALADLNASYRLIVGRIADALAVEIPGIAWAGISDLVWRDRKVSGNAQQRKRRHLLHHGTLLYAFDLSSIDKFLQQPPRMPDYRRARPHDEFVANLPLDERRLKEILTAAWDATTERTDWPREVVTQLVDEKYSRDEWHSRR